MRAKFIFEKFTDESDPIADMGIGMLHKIEEWIKSLHLMYSPPISDIDEVLRYCISDNKPITDTFIDYLINHYNNYDKNEALRYCIFYQRKTIFADTLIKKGAKFENLSQKAYYVLGMNGTLASLTPEEKLLIACKIGDFNEFKNCIENGVKLKIGMVNSLYIDDCYF